MTLSPREARKTPSRIRHSPTRLAEESDVTGALIGVS